MKYSKKLNGYWEEGYHYYFEIRNNTFTLRDAGKRIVFTTKIEYDARALESGERTELRIGETALAKNYKGEPMWYITGMWYENDTIHMDTHYTITGDSSYDLHRVDHDPFYNYLILDKKYLPKLKGDWIEWRKDGKRTAVLSFKGDRVSYKYDGSELSSAKIHVIAYRSSPDVVFINDADLTVSGVMMFSRLDIKPDMITGYEMVCDADMPLSVFARADMIDKIQIPAEAMRPIRNTMEYDPEMHATAED